MIEINLLPGSDKRSKRRGGPKFALPGPLAKLKSLPKFDKGMAIMAGSWVAALLLFSWLFFGTRARKAGLEEQLTVARMDSTRLAAIIESTKTMEDRRSLIAGKLTIVQSIDANRYIWSHILDEIARALPEHTWLVSINYVTPDSADKFPKFKIEGRTGSNFALTAYLLQLEASPFIRTVRLLSSQLERDEGRLVYAFVLEAAYEEPPPDLIETTPLFASAEEPDSARAGASGVEGPAGAGAQGGTGRPPAAAPPARPPQTPAKRPGQEPR